MTSAPCLVIQALAPELPVYLHRKPLLDQADPEAVSSMASLQIRLH